MLRDIEKIHLTEVQRQLDGHVQLISALDCIFEAMEQETISKIKIPRQAVSEVGRTIQRSILKIQELMGTLANDLPSSPDGTLWKSNSVSRQELLSVWGLFRKGIEQNKPE